MQTTNQVQERKPIRIHLFEQGQDLQQNDLLVVDVDSVEGHKRITLSRTRKHLIVCECKQIISENGSFDLARSIQYHHDSGEHDEFMERVS